MVALNIDVRQIEPAAGFDPVPAGWYKVMIDESGPMTPAKSNPQHAYLPIRFTIVEGQYKNKKLFARLNLINGNEQAKQIAYRELSAIGHAVGVLNIEMSEQLHNKPLWVKVKVSGGQKNEQTGEVYEDKNEIQSYKGIDFVPPNSGAGPAVSAGPVVPPVATAPVIPPVAAPPVAPLAPPVAAPPPPPPPVATFPPEGWTTHPTAPGYFYMGQEVLNEADLRARMAPPAAPPPPVVAAPAAGWQAAPAQPWTAPPAAGQVAAPPPVTPPPPAAVVAQQASAPWNQPKA
jgi:hypothetical protein